jgi:hypothetical protein
MIFGHKLYYNLNYTNPNKKNIFRDICSKPKKLYKVDKLYNAKQVFFLKHRKKYKNQNLKLLNYEHLLTEKKKTLIFKNN